MSPQIIVHHLLGAGDPRQPQLLDLDKLNKRP